MTTTYSRPAESSPHRGEIPWTGRALSIAREHRAALVVLGVYIASAFVVPTLSDTARHDDWVYSRAAEVLAHRHHLQVSPLAAANTVFEALWGGLFGAVFGVRLGIFRASSVVLMLLSGAAFYALGAEIGIGRGRAALGTAAYLFNPIGYVLGFSFMTDPHLLALVVISTFFYVRGLALGPASWKATVIGSAFSGLAFLSRPQGALVPAAAFAFLVVTGRIRVNAAGLRRTVEVVGIPAAVVVAFYAWVMLGNGVSSSQGDFIHAITASPVTVTWSVLRAQSFLHPAYIGFFVLPVTALAAFRPVRLLRSLPPAGWLLVLGWSYLLLGGYRHFAARPKTMPFAGSWFLRSELGPISNYGNRGPLAPGYIFGILTVVCFVSSVLFAVVLAGKLRPSSERGRTAAGLLVAIALAMIAGAIPPSYAFAPGTLDRYLLPTLPFVLLLALWALPRDRLATVVGWGLVVAVGAFAVAGTRDTLVLEQSIWKLSQRAVDHGARLDQIDGGAGWDGWHMAREDVTPQVSRTAKPPWWVAYFAPKIDSTYVVSLSPWPGYDVVEAVRYSDWLHGGNPSVYLLRRTTNR